MAGVLQFSDHQICVWVSVPCTYPSHHVSSILQRWQSWPMVTTLSKAIYFNSGFIIVRRAVVYPAPGIRFPMLSWTSSVIFQSAPSLKDVAVLVDPRKEAPLCWLARMSMAMCLGSRSSGGLQRWHQHPMPVPARVERMINASHRGALCYLMLFGCGRVLSFGQSVYPGYWTECLHHHCGAQMVWLPPILRPSPFTDIHSRSGPGGF